MHGTTTSIRTAGRFPGTQVAAAELDPAWRPWVRLLDLALEAADEAEWERGVPEVAPGREPDAPLLHGTTLRLDARRSRKLVRELLRACHPERSEGSSSSR
jgi:hypothetical protein